MVSFLGFASSNIRLFSLSVGCIWLKKVNGCNDEIISLIITENDKFLVDFLSFNLFITLASVIQLI